ncbi:hypothetical protein GE061_018043 [Apolygus lucorum]|uniref:Protein rolling stone n=1 Tax=Apolygus lucorum TaxID=248454 RepID=A0A8S9XCS5_APOLU|nr:hypothetical protein GE061_018043 [Apolygus lucorum]
MFGIRELGTSHPAAALFLLPDFWEHVSKCSRSCCFLSINSISTLFNSPSIAVLEVELDVEEEHIECKLPSRTLYLTTLFERLIFNPPPLEDLQSVERVIKKHGDYSCRSHHFYSSTFQKRFQISKLYLAYRWIICFLYLLSCVLTTSDPTHEHVSVYWYLKYLIYITNISLTLGFVQALMGAIIITKGVHIYGFRSNFPVDENIDKHKMIYWKLHQCSILSAMSVSMTFWLVINPKRPQTVDMNNVVGHAINSFYALIDWLVTGLPYNFTDFWVYMVYTLAYFLFTFIYWHAGGTGRIHSGEMSAGRIIFPKCTDWDRPEFALLCYFICMTHSALLHVMLCGANKLRVIWMLKPSSEPHTTVDPQLSTVTTNQPSNLF